MARFQDLSNELLLGVLEEVLPDDIMSIALTSKRIHQLAIPRLEEHRRLQKRYTNFKNMIEYKPSHWHDPGGLLADLLCKIISGDRIGNYVKKIHLDSWNSYARDGWKPDAVFQKQGTTGKGRRQPDLRTNMETIEEAVCAAEIIPKEEVDDWLLQIRRGNEDPLVALLLLLAPKLHALRFVVPYDREDSSYLLKTIQRIAAQESTVKPYPSQLQTVDMCFAETWENLGFVKAFMSLPSLTSITTDGLFVDGRTYEEKSAILLQPSDATEVCFRNGFLPESAISELLRGMKDLKTFRYDFQHLWRDEEYTPSFDCQAVIRSLEANASHTLERLTLSAREIETSQITLLQGFHALQKVKFHTSHCFDVEDGKLAANLINSLPVSLVKLTMHWYEATSVDTVETLTEAILGFIRESKNQLPRLRTLHLSTGDAGESDAFWECLASDETAQINPLLSFYIRGPGGDGNEIGAWGDNVCTCGQNCFGNGSN